MKWISRIVTVLVMALFSKVIMDDWNDITTTGKWVECGFTLALILFLLINQWHYEKETNSLNRVFYRKWGK